MTVVRQPARTLGERVGDYYGWEERTGKRTRRREGPGPEVAVILSFGNEWRIGGALEPERALAPLTSFVGGLRSSSVLTEHDGWSAGIQINLEPIAAHVLFGLPMCDLAEQAVPLDALLADAHLLVERLYDTGSWPERFAILDDELSARLADARGPTPGVAWAWRQLQDSHGRVAVGALCDELGWSRRRLVARFREEIGLPPKAVARLLRFEHALELVGRGARWAEVAFAAGYYDQSHLINEFRSITGITPRQYVTNLQDGADIAA
jgi:AraC-like DNA-binding protein